MAWQNNSGFSGRAKGAKAFLGKGKRRAAGRNQDMKIPRSNVLVTVITMNPFGSTRSTYKMVEKLPSIFTGPVSPHT